MRKGELSVAVLGFAILLGGCSSTNAARPSTQMEKPVAEVSDQVAEVRPLKLPPPKLNEVAGAVARVFGRDLVMEREAAHTFITGDFNGDGFEDLAVIVRPAAQRLDEVNSTVANWTIQDADQYYVPPVDKAVVREPVLQRQKVKAGEEVLAVIHGFGQDGWRSPDARQAYLVRHAAAPLESTVPSISRKEIRAMRLAVSSDLIREKRDGRQGFVFWTGAAYGWHPEGS